MPWTLELGGVTVGHDQSWKWAEDAPELFGFDSMRQGDTSRPDTWGETTVGPDLPNGRDVTFKLVTDTATEAAALALYDQLLAAWNVAKEDQELVVATPSRTYWARGRIRRMQPDLKLAPQGILTAAVQIRMPDPRFYDVTLHTSTAELSTSTGGLAFPAAFPISFGSIVPGEAIIVNAGNTPTGLIAVVMPDAGQTIHEPSFELAETGEQVVFAGLDIPDGQTLVVDWHERTAVLIDGTAETDVGNFIDRTISDWWTHNTEIPAATVHVRFSSTGGVGSAVCSYRSAWML